MAVFGRGKMDTGAAEDYFPVTPDDGVDLPVETRELIIASGGAVALTKLDGTQVILTLPAGRFALRVRRVSATGTTATGITGVV